MPKKNGKNEYVHSFPNSDIAKESCIINGKIVEAKNDTDFVSSISSQKITIVQTTFIKCSKYFNSFKTNAKLD